MSLEGADVYIDGIGAIFFNGQVLKIDLLALYPDSQEANKLNPRLAGRIAMPINAALQLRDGLIKLVSDIQKAQESNQAKVDSNQSEAAPRKKEKN